MEEKVKPMRKMKKVTDNSVKRLYSHYPKKVIIDGKPECNREEFVRWYDLMKQQNHITDADVARMSGYSRAKLWRILSGKQKIDPMMAAGFYIIFDYRQEYTVEEFLKQLGVYNYWDLDDDGKPSYKYKESYWD